MSGSWHCKVFSEEARLVHRRQPCRGPGQSGPSLRRSRAVTSPCRRSTDTLQDMRSAMCLALEDKGVEVEVHHHEVATAGQCEIGTKFAPLVQRADWTQILKYTVQNVAHIATARPRPSCPSRSSATTVPACTCISRSGRTARTCSQATATPAFRSSRCIYIGGIIKHARALNAITNPGTNSYKRLVPGFEAPVKLAYSARNRSASIRDSLCAVGQGTPHRSALPGSDGKPVPRLHCMMMAGLDGVQNKIHPGDPADKNLYDLPPEEDAKIPTVCSSSRPGAGGTSTRIASS